MLVHVYINVCVRARLHMHVEARGQQPSILFDKTGLSLAKILVIRVG